MIGRFQLRTAFDVAIVAVSLSVIASSLTLAILHQADFYGISHLPGIWMTLARSANDGVLYPPIAADGHYAGTRYMPAFFLFVAGVQRIAGDYLWATKLCSIFAMSALLLALSISTWRIGKSYVFSIAAAALLLSYSDGLAALLAPHADGLAVALALIGLLSIDDDRVDAKLRRLVAVACFSVSFLTKFSSIAGAAAMFLWMAYRGKRAQLVVSLILYGALIAIGLAWTQWRSDGRFAENMQWLASGGMDKGSIQITLARLIYALRQSPSFAAILLVAFYVAITRILSGRTSIWELYFLAVVGATWIIFASPGTGTNHLLELEAAALIIVASFVNDCRDHPAADLKLRGSVLVLLAIAAPVHFSAWSPVRSAQAITADELRRAVGADEVILTEDASIDAALGRRPTVMDAFAFRLLSEKGAIDDRELTLRVRRHEFAKLIMMRRIDVAEESLAPRFHFGPRVTDALREEYRFESTIGGYSIFRPRSAVEPKK